MTASAFGSHQAQFGRHLFRSRLGPLNSSPNVSVHDPETGGAVDPGGAVGVGAAVGVGVGWWCFAGVAFNAAGAIIAVPRASPIAAKQVPAKRRCANIASQTPVALPPIHSRSRRRLMRARMWHNSNHAGPVHAIGTRAPYATGGYRARVPPLPLAHQGNRASRHPAGRRFESG